MNQFELAKTVTFDEVWIGRAAGYVNGVVWSEVDEDGRINFGWDLHVFEFWDEEGCNRILIDRDVVAARVCHLFEDAALKMQTEAELFCEVACV